MKNNLSMIPPLLTYTKHEYFSQFSSFHLFSTHNTLPITDEIALQSFWAIILSFRYTSALMRFAIFGPALQ